MVYYRLSIEHGGYPLEKTGGLISQNGILITKKMMRPMNSGAWMKRLGCVSATKADVVDFAIKHGDFFIIYGGFCLPSNMQI